MKSEAITDYIAMSAPEMLSACGGDAVKWAAAFCQMATQLGVTQNGGPLDEGWMIGWFANAIEQSHAVRRWAVESAATAAAPAVPGWQPIETAPKSLADGSNVRGIYLLGYCPDESAIDPSSCICVTWWEPNIDGGVWYGEGGYAVRPTHWMSLPPAPSAVPAASTEALDAILKAARALPSLKGITLSSQDPMAQARWLTALGDLQKAVGKYDSVVTPPVGAEASVEQGVA